MNTISGRITVEVTGVPVPLSQESQPFAWLIVRGMKNNTDVVHVGSRSVRAKAGFESGIMLRATDEQRFENGDLKDLWVDSIVAGEGVFWGGMV